MFASDNKKFVEFNASLSFFTGFPLQIIMYLPLNTSKNTGYHCTYLFTAMATTHIFPPSMKLILENSQRKLNAPRGFKKLSKGASQSG